MSENTETKGKTNEGWAAVLEKLANDTDSKEIAMAAKIGADVIRHEGHFSLCPNFNINDCLTKSIKAIKYLLDNVQTNPALRYCLVNSESHRQLIAAEAMYDKRDLVELEKERQRDLQPDYRRIAPRRKQYQWEAEFYRNAYCELADWDDRDKKGEEFAEFIATKTARHFGF